MALEMLLLVGDVKFFCGRSSIASTLQHRMPGILRVRAIIFSNLLLGHECLARICVVLSTDDTLIALIGPSQSAILCQLHHPDVRVLSRIYLICRSLPLPVVFGPEVVGFF